MPSKSPLTRKVPAKKSHTTTADTAGNGERKDSAPPFSARSFTGFTEVTSFLWSVADLLRGDYKQADYGKVILPFTVLRRLDAVLRDTKPKVLAKFEQMK